MNISKAIRFLKKNQPLPDDKELENDSEIFKKYDEVRKYFLDNPNPICIPLFLNSFGSGSGFGTYQLVEDVLLKYPSGQVIPYLIQGLNSDRYGVRYWNSQIASSFPNRRLIKPLAKLLTDKESDIRYAVIVALVEINDEKVLGIVKDAQKQEEDIEILELIEDVISSLEI